MTFVDPSQLPMTGLGRRFNPASDLTKRVFENEDMPLYELFMATLRQGRSVIEGVTFRGCRIEGPAVMLVLDGTNFEATNFGNSKGDIANMVLRPVANMAIGAIPVRNCTFDGCEFHGLGFTGNAAILEQILSIRSVA
ncbi:hypothetical protein [Brevundimonas bacteroides]|uniref:hypothetical protein n=1 Tax=Brevundimonas bacteroides TaxID=74311 RepID=UPI000690BBAC|nr:hypothetical protein [Brevundimonas bacteroides]